MVIYLLLFELIYIEIGINEIGINENVKIAWINI